MKRVISFLLIMIMVTFSFSIASATTEIGTEINPVTAEEMTIEKVSGSFSMSSNLEKIGVPIEYTVGMKLDGEVYKLYPVFIDREEAMTNVKELYVDMLEEMKNAFSLGTLNSQNWEDYLHSCDSFRSYIEDSTTYSEEEKNKFNKETYGLEEFFDIYENDIFNEEIMKRIESAAGMNAMNAKSVADLQASNDALAEIKSFLPYNTGSVEAVNEVMAKNNTKLMVAAPRMAPTMISPLSYSGNSSFSISKGTTYAASHARSTSSAKYGYISGADCTNFVSQIKHAGGVPVYGTVNSTNGWNYSSTEAVSGNIYYSYSTNWTLAEGFGNFFGTKGLYPSMNAGIHPCAAFVNLSKAVKPGSFICYDQTSDGNWNHMAYVTEVDTTYVSWKDASIPYKYKDFRIAQHTHGYNELVSNSENKWEELALNNNSILFGIIN